MTYLNENRVRVIFYGGYITGILLFVYDFALVIIGGHPWWMYLVLTIAGLSLGFMFLFVENPFLSKNDETKSSGFPFLVYIRDGEHRYRVSLILNPIYFALLSNAIFLTAISLFGRKVGFAAGLLLISPLVFWAGQNYKNILDKEE